VGRKPTPNRPFKQFRDCGALGNCLFPVEPERLRAGVIAIKVAKLRDTPVTNQFERLRIVLIDTAMADVPSSPFDHKHNLGGLVFAFAASKP
jgi:hypothetical protein